MSIRQYPLQSAFPQPDVVVRVSSPAFVFKKAVITYDTRSDPPDALERCADFYLRTPPHETPQCVLNALTRTLQLTSIRDVEFGFANFAADRHYDANRHGLPVIRVIGRRALDLFLKRVNLPQLVHYYFKSDVTAAFEDHERNEPLHRPAIDALLTRKTDATGSTNLTRSIYVNRHGELGDVGHLQTNLALGPYKGIEPRLNPDATPVLEHACLHMRFNRAGRADATSLTLFIPRITSDVAAYMDERLRSRSSELVQAYQTGHLNVSGATMHHFRDVSFRTPVDASGKLGGEYTVQGFDSITRMFQALNHGGMTQHDPLFGPMIRPVFYPPFLQALKTEVADYVRFQKNPTRVARRLEKDVEAVLRSGNGPSLPNLR